MSYINKFKFVGQVVISKEESRVLKEGRSAAGNNWIKFSFGVRTDNGMSKYVNLVATDTDRVYTLSSEGKSLVVDRADYHNPDVIDEVSSFKLYKSDIGGVRKSFISQYEYIKYLSETIPSLTNSDEPVYLEIAGDVTHYMYNGKWQEQYIVRRVYQPAEKPHTELSAKIDLFYKGEDIDFSQLETDNQVFIQAYVEEYVSLEKGTRFIPLNVVLNFSGFDKTDERHMKIKEYKLRPLKNVPKNQYVHQLWDCRYFDGAKEVELTKDMLTNLQKEQIELGLATLESFKGTSKFVGDKVRELRLNLPIYKGKFSDGMLTYEGNAREFEELIATESVTEKLSIKAMERKKAEAKIEHEDLPSLDEDEDLF